MEQSPPDRKHPVELTAALLEAAAAGSPSVFLSFYDLAAPELYGLVLDIVTDREAAEQILLEVFSGIWRDLPQHQTGDRPAFAQVLSTAHRCAVRHIRARKPHPEDRQKTEPIVADVPPAGQAGESAERLPENVAAAVAALPPDQRLVIGLLYYSGLTAAETAARLGWPEETVRTCALLAMQAMRAPFSILLGHSGGAALPASPEAADEAHPDAAKEFREKAALHALGALEAAEGGAFEAHIREGCRACAEAARAFTDTAAAIGLASPPVTPPEYVKDILAWRLDRESAPAAPPPRPARQPEVRPEPALFTHKPQRTGWRRFLPWLT